MHFISFFIIYTDTDRNRSKAMSEVVAQLKQLLCISLLLGVLRITAAG
jgi:hypothetical protein